jgi:hypothetical protein
MTISKPLRDHRGVHLIAAAAEQPAIGRKHTVSSGGGTRTHNLRINSLIQPVSEAE